ncbi:conserved hypothetical protein [Methanococcus vannielii SB]|uniref:Uncharacterized protein n=1 Tax=Methanococcus vannielii (strain ATCC 35089 / DSM 1224 / JCM 13029 / OCM 148 / SB) TaxID=406327 RepID=A6USW2_METVS|nr:hypothetical protein [Methanococcus vannielii]ABR55584.1 conserved hypothetical protein [Methanococcus vannielii SB]
MHKLIVKELQSHLPYTIFGGILGVIFLSIFYGVSSDLSYFLFYKLHSLHVFLSAFVTTSVYKLKKTNVSGLKDILLLFFIGYIGSIGIATLSDSLIPYFGEILLDLPNRGPHIGFIEEWYIINPLAFLGIIIAYFRPLTKLPHSFHVLLSTSASLFHIIISLNSSLSIFTYLIILFFLIIAVWIPCCTSDIIFPMIFVNDKNALNTIKNL